jgi:hypothetical protein
VEGYVATAIALKQLHAALRKLFGRGNHVGGFGVPPESDDRRVLEQQENIADTTVFPKLDQFLLQP